MSENTVAAPAGAKRSILKAIVITAVVLASLGGGAFYYLHASAAPPAPPEPGLLSLEPFVVNLADPGGRRFLRVTVRIVLASKEDADLLAEDEVRTARTRSAILELLTAQLGEHLMTPDGKAELKTAIAEQATRALGQGEVIDVLFTEFVVQF